MRVSMILLAAFIGVVSAEVPLEFRGTPFEPTIGHKAFFGIQDSEVDLQGGSLTLLRLGESMPLTATIRTAPGMARTAAAAKLVEVVNEKWPAPEEGKTPTFQGTMHENEIMLWGSTVDYAAASTDPGIPLFPPCYSLTCSWVDGTLQASWDDTHTKGWSPYFEAGTVGRAVDEEQITVRLADTSELDKLIVRVHHAGYPTSNVAMMRMMGPNAQEELFVVPFHMGVQPNWAGWHASGDAEKVTLAEGIKPELADEAVARERWFPREHPDNKRYYQSITARDGGVGGVYRKFLGLEPGATYRVVTRMNTLAMNESEGDWRFSFHAVAHPYATELTPEQMAGVAPLPNGAEGPDAALVAAYGAGKTTDGTYAEVTTQDSAVGDLTLGADEDTITVWFRHTAAQAGSGVATDWIRLEKLGSAGVPPSAVQQEE